MKQLKIFRPASLAFWNKLKALWYLTVGLFLANCFFNHKYINNEKINYAYIKRQEKFITKESVCNHYIKILFANPFIVLHHQLPKVQPGSQLRITAPASRFCAGYIYASG
jgi:hypothetical protein